MIALRAGHEPGHRPAPRGERHVAEVRHRAGGEPAGDGQGGLRAARPGLRFNKFCKINKIYKILQIFGGLVLGCIKPKFCKKICAVRQHFSSSTRFAYFCTAAISKFSQKIGLKNQYFLWKMLSNAYFLAKFRFDTAENEPAKNLQNLPILLTLTP